MHDEIEAAELLRCTRDERPDGVGVGEVAVAPACGEHAEAVSLEPPCDRAADAPGAAGDERCVGVGHAGNDKLPRAKPSNRKG